MQALILAGGLGTRLQNVVKDRPKSMALVNGKPFLEYQIEFLKKNGINDIILSTGYMSEVIENYDFDLHGISIKHSKEKESLGTGGAIKNARNLLDQRFFVLNGDTMFLIDLKSLIHFHDENYADCTLAITNLKEKSRFGNVIIDNRSRINEFKEKENTKSNFISAGTYIFEKKIFEWDSLPDKFSLEKDLLPNLVRTKKVYGFSSNSYFIDIGTAEDYKKFRDDIELGHLKL